MVEAVFNGRVIACSDDTMFLEGNHYFPAESLRRGFLNNSRAKSLCPWKGIASYYTVVVDGVEGRNAAWTYRHTSPLTHQEPCRLLTDRHRAGRRMSCGTGSLSGPGGARIDGPLAASWVSAI